MRYRQNTKGDILYGPPVIDTSKIFGQENFRITSIPFCRA